jgi:hypothetical protein
MAPVTTPYRGLTLCDKRIELQGMIAFAEQHLRIGAGQDHTLLVHQIHMPCLTMMQRWQKTSGIGFSKQDPGAEKSGRLSSRRADGNGQENQGFGESLHIFKGARAEISCV